MIGNGRLGVDRVGRLASRWSKSFQNPQPHDRQPLALPLHSISSQMVYRVRNIKLNRSQDGAASRPLLALRTQSL